jgi:hypothetical protein
MKIVDPPLRLLEARFDREQGNVGLTGTSVADREIGILKLVFADDACG